MFIIDRFENDWVIVEFDRKTFNLPRSIFPAGAKEGDVINIKIIVDKKATTSRKKSIKDLADSLFED
ncbi:hypothetical protein DK28_0202030 [Peptococcaceae bacterium SCADC1_2_3]|jgi:hypothetical protein|nr:hypothetical protein DK28_0202030 [Peptococcaceae bacterium SCADC1_2_3]KFI35928.1 hypothetical protein HY00_10730 [Peptococcaceae bacterium SCADC1_2_3]